MPPGDLRSKFSSIIPFRKRPDVTAEALQLGQKPAGLNM
jgi:hypothetical protein